MKNVKLLFFDNFIVFFENDYKISFNLSKTKQANHF